MSTTYAVKWLEPDGHAYLGRLALGVRALGLDGRQPHGPVLLREIAYEEITGLRVGSRGADRLDGRPSVVVDHAAGRYLVTSAGVGAGIVQEIAGRLAELCRAAPAAIDLRKTRSKSANGP